MQAATGAKLCYHRTFACLHNLFSSLLVLALTLCLRCDVVEGLVIILAFFRSPLIFKPEAR